MRVRLTMALTLDAALDSTGSPTGVAIVTRVEGFRLRSPGGQDRPLRGRVQVGGAKNSALKLMAASLLAPGTTTITNLPDILDVEVMARLLEELGCSTRVDHGLARVEIDVPEQPSHRA